MSSPSYVEVAYFVKTFGLHGELKAVLANNVKLDIRELEVIFLKDNGQHIPYFIETCNVKKEEIIIKLEDVNTLEAAKKLCRQKIYVDKKTDTSVSDVKDNPNVIVGYKVLNTNVLVGVVDRLESYPQQIMAFIKPSEGEEIMIPLNEKFIIDIDDENSELHLDLPDGLLDL